MVGAAQSLQGYYTTWDCKFVRLTDPITQRRRQQIHLKHQNKLIILYDIATQKTITLGTTKKTFSGKTQHSVTQGCTNPRQLKSVWRHLIFMGTQYETSFM